MPKRTKITTDEYESELARLDPALLSQMKGLPTRKNEKISWTPQQDAAIMYGRLHRASYRDIARVLGVSEGTLWARHQYLKGDSHAKSDT